MLLKKALIVLVGCTVFVMAADASALDNRRKGFFFGGGLGPGLTHVSSEKRGVSDDLTKGALAFDFRIGYGTTDNFQVYYTHKFSLYDPAKMKRDYEHYFDVLEQESLKSVLYWIICPVALPLIPLASGASGYGVGATYFLEPRAPSFFFDAGFGGSTFLDPFDDFRGGFAFFGGFGYEFSRHWTVGFQLVYGHADEESYSISQRARYQVKANAWNLMFTVNGLAY